jgi:hypothetical protein
VPRWVSAAQAHSRVSTINFDIWIVFCGGASLWISHEQYTKQGKVLENLGIQSKVFAGSLTDWSALVSFCTSSPQQSVEYQLWYLIFLVGGVYEYPMKNILRTQSSWPLGVSIKGIVRVFNWLKCLGGFLQKPQAHSRLSNINFDIWIFSCGGGSLLISDEKIIKDGKVLTHLGNQSKVLVGSLTDWSAWVGFCTSSPQSGVNYQFWYLNFLLWRGVYINIPWKIY